MDDRADVVEGLITGQVQLHFRRRRPTLLARDHRARGVDPHQVVERHLLVVDRRRGDDDRAV
jgi:hypothetical protein